MILHNIKSKRKDSGFTIVELLVVIVVIGILAAITIVSYTGVTTRAKAAQAQSNATSAQSVAEAYNADLGYYPATAAAFSTGSASTKLPSGMSIIADAATTTITAANGQTTVGYSCLTNCTSPVTGGRITWWDFGAATPGVKYVYIGTATSAGPWGY